MTSRQDFTDEEWIRIRRAPLVAGVAISLADPGGPIELAKETMASLRSATLPPSQEELLAPVALDVQVADAGKEGGLMGFGAERVSAGERQMLDQVRATLGMA